MEQPKCSKGAGAKVKDTPPVWRLWCKTCRGNPALHTAQCDEVRSAKDALSFSVELLGRWRTMLRKPLLKTGGKEEKCAANQVVSRKDVLSEAMRLFLLEALHHTEEAPWQQQAQWQLYQLVWRVLAKEKLWPATRCDNAHALLHQFVRRDRDAQEWSSSSADWAGVVVTLSDSSLHLSCDGERLSLPPKSIAFVPRLAACVLDVDKDVEKGSWDVVSSIAC